jgi:hypothetical protein
MDIDKLKAEHGEVFLVDVCLTMVAFKRCSRGEYKRFRAAVTDERKKADALETLARACVVYPEPKEFDQFLDKYPAAADVIGSKVLEVAGAVEAEAAKKA